MIVISDAGTINIIKSVNYASRIVIDDSIVMFLMVSLTDASTGVIYNRNMFIVQATRNTNYRVRLNTLDHLIGVACFQYLKELI